jgi:signal transduction histidine kinase
VLVNLLLNACQASKPGDHVRIGLQSAPHSAHIAVTDTGAGMLPQDCQRAFDPFFSTKVDGGGLGLPICLDIVRRHGGDLMLTSQLGHGTTATVILPT